MKKHTGFILLTAAFGLFSANAEVDCIALSVSVKHAAASDRSNVLDLVSREVASSPGCACEIVKAAIEGSSADTKMVAAIVQAAATAAPEHMRLISQCAVAIAPDALAAVQAVIALLDPNLGEAGDSAKSAKGSKDAKHPVGEVASMPNPLDFPGQGPVGPTPGGPGGSPLIPFLPPMTVIPPIVGPPVETPEEETPPVVPDPPPVTRGNFAPAQPAPQTQPAPRNEVIPPPNRDVF